MTTGAAFYKIIVVLALTVNQNWTRAVFDHEEKWEKLYKTEIKSSILKQLKMFESPKNNNFSKVYPKSFTERLIDEEQEEKIQLILTAEQVSNTPSAKINFIPKSNTLEAESFITSAKLSLFKTPTITESDILTVFLKEDNTIISSTSVSKEYGGWLDFDITTAFQKWAKLSNNGLKSLSLLCDNCNNDHLEISSEKQHAPYLLINVVKKKPSPRQRRKTWTCNEDASCCSRPVFVSFEDLSWKWVLSPQGFWTNKCMGNCKDAKPGKNSCCVPITLGSITMFYHDADYILYGKKIENIVTKDCGCR